MRNITSFDRPTLNTLRAEMQAVLDKFGANLEFDVGNMRFTDNEVEIKVKAKIKGKKTMSDRQLELAAHSAGIKNLVNKTGDKLVGYSPRAHRYPFIYERNGRKYKCSEFHARTLFA